MATTSAARVTLAEYHALPEGPPHYELDDGELILMTSPTPEHQDILVEFAHWLRRGVRERDAGRVFAEVDVYLPDGRAYIPDVSFLSTDRLHLLNPADRKIHGAPDLVVEITPSEPERDRVRKFRIYFGNGVRWYWIIDSQTLAIEEYLATDDGYLRTASVARGEEFRPQLFPWLVLNLNTIPGIGF